MKIPSFILPTVATLAATALPISHAAAQKLAPQTLRGYGTISANTRAVAAGSLTRINCESAAKARLLQAKYLSDLSALPGVKP